MLQQPALYTFQQARICCINAVHVARISEQTCHLYMRQGSHIHSGLQLLLRVVCCVFFSTPDSLSCYCPTPPRAAPAAAAMLSPR